MLVAGSLTTAMSVVILTAFLTRFLPSRLLFVYAWIAALVLFVLRRAVTRWIRSYLWSRHHYVDRVLVVGSGNSGRRIMQAMMSSPTWGYRVVGFADDQRPVGPLPVATEHRVERAEWLGGLSDVGRVVTERKIDEVIIALPPEQFDAVTSIVEQCQEQAVTFKVVPDLLQLSLDRVDLGEVAGVPLIGIKPASIHGGQLVVKRAIDIVVASAVLLISAIPMLLIALCVRADSPGPVLFRQQRIGRNGRSFTLVKFRCMVDGADQLRASLIAAHRPEDARLFKLRHDPRLTRVGRFLRRWSLDELPQFWQVLTGSMSLVGPRPQLPEEVEGYEEWHHQRLLVAPGLTGLWQINGRSNLTFDEMVRLDLYYAEHWSPWLDLKIVLRTVPAVITGRGAY
jgi:exopolysaccharide biosynthesis polyprenyl glycosylphosphotransferase